MSFPMKVFLIYIGIISAISVVICCYDKLVSKTGKVSLRIPEASLLIISSLGGSLAMFLCMQIIRHKTKHPKFMVGIPLVMLLQGALIYGLFHFDILYL